MRRNLFNEDHESFRKTLRAFIEAEVAPNYDQWFEDALVPRDFYYKLAELGIFGIEVPEEYGGAGIDSYKYSVVIYEEMARAAVNFGGSGVHVELCLPYLLTLGTPEQLKRWMPPFVSGEEMYAIAMTEPGAGSDLAGMSTTAMLSEDGTHYVLNGAKTFITGGYWADRMIVCARTDKARAGRPPARHLAAGGRHQGGRATPSAASWTRSACAPPTPPSWRSSTSRCPSRTCSARRTWASTTSAATCPASGSASRSAPTRRRRPRCGSPRSTRSSGPSSASRSPPSRTPSSSWPTARPTCDAMQAVVDRAVEAIDEGELTPAEAASVKLFCTETVLAGHRPLPAAARRLRLHQRVPDRPPVRRQPGHPDLRRHLRGHEDDHRQEHGPVGLRSTAHDRIPNCDRDRCRPRHRRGRRQAARRRWHGRGRDRPRCGRL